MTNAKDQDPTKDQGNREKREEKEDTGEKKQQDEKHDEWVNTDPDTIPGYAF